NLIHNFSMLNLELDDAEWIALAGDEAPAVRRRALPLAARRLEFAQLRPVVEQLMQAEDPADRLLVAETLRYRPEPETLEVLERLTGDPDDEVAGEALITLARRAPTEARMATLVDWLEAGRLGAQQGKNALRVLLTRAPLTEETIARLTAIDRSVWQAEIAQVHLASLERKALGRAVLGYLDSPQSEVRRMATAYLSGLPELLSREVAEGLLQSRHSDVRLRAVALLPQMPREVSQSLAPQFLFDPDGDVRASALRYLADMRANGWERMVRGALSDKDPAPQREAIRVLSRLPLEERQAIIEPFLSGDPDSEIASQLRRLLPNR
ncbi:MAG: HEAT repeat domain-containing protein, partial [Opitutales bacterium]